MKVETELMDLRRSEKTNVVERNRASWRGDKVENWEERTGTGKKEVHTS
jgi:hypothetical protein